MIECFEVMKKSFFWITGTFFALVAIIAEALDAHTLSKISETGQANYRTATLFLFFHSVVMLILPYYLEKYAAKLLKISSGMIAAGAFIFTTTVIIKVFIQNPWWGFITPVGGGILILGWILFLIAALSSRN